MFVSSAVGEVSSELTADALPGVSLRSFAGQAHSYAEWKKFKWVELVQTGAVIQVEMG